MFFAAILLLQACGPSGEGAAYKPEVNEILVLSPDRAALQGFAKKTIIRRVGFDIYYEWEFIDDKSGRLFACGKFSNQSRSRVGYYLAKSGEVEISWGEYFPEEWRHYCYDHGK